MQAVRQCSMCANRAVGGFLRHHTEVSLLRTSKYFLKRGATCIQNLSISEGVPVSSRRSGVQRSGEGTNTAQINKAPFSIVHGLCADQFTQVKNLSHNSLIRRAVSVVTDSASTLLSQNTLALVDALTDYSKVVHARIALQRRYLASVGKLSPAELDSLQQAINSLHTDVSSRLNECNRFESSWSHAVNLCNMAAEVACSSGAEQASFTVRTNLQVAQSQVEEAQKVSADAEKKLAETEVEQIQRMAEYTATLENYEELEVHEAYLRED